jgi:hypothetical protein
LNSIWFFNEGIGLIKVTKHLKTTAKVLPAFSENHLRCHSTAQLTIVQFLK